MSRPISNGDVFKAIADPSRRLVLEILANGEQSVSELHLRIRLTQPALSQHLKVLRDVGLVHHRKKGRERIYALHPKPLEEVADWIKQYESFWTSKLDALGEHLERKHGSRSNEASSEH